MKKLNQTFSLILAALGLTVSLVACQNGTNNQQSGPLPVYGNCYGCGTGLNGGPEFFRSQSQNFSGGLQMNLSFRAQNAGQTPYFGGSSNVVSYYGPVVVNGVMSVNYSVNNGYCVLPSGQYTLNTVQAGSWRGAIVNGVILQAYGPANISLSISNAQVSAKSYGQLGQTWSEVPQVGRLFGNIVIQSVNGYSCYQEILVN